MCEADDPRRKNMQTDDQHPWYLRTLPEATNAHELYGDNPTLFSRNTIPIQNRKKLNVRKKVALKWHGGGMHNTETNNVTCEEETYDNMADDEHDSDFLEDTDNLFEEVVVDMEGFKNIEDDVEQLKEHVIEEDFNLELSDFNSLTDEENDHPIKIALRRERRKQKRRNKDHAAEPFFVTQTFFNRHEIKRSVRQLAVETRRQLQIVKNDPCRFKVSCKGCCPSFVAGESKGKGVISEGASGEKCDKAKKAQKSKGDGAQSESLLHTPAKKKRFNKPTCPWSLHVSKLESETSFSVKTFINEHKCLQVRKVNLATVSWLAEEIVSTVSVNPDIQINVLQDLVEKKYQIELGRQKVFRAKTMASEKTQGDYKAQYELLASYATELRRTDPGSSVIICSDEVPNSDTRKFKRMYVCLQALKKGFKLCGRPILGLDGCFMKGPFPGQILTAVGIDPNNGIYPLCYALVEAETRVSWEWFLEMLGRDLDLHSGANFTFISDRQKGLLPALEGVFPDAEHRFCARHIHENFRSQWRGDLYKNMFWSCATATTPHYFEREMGKIKEKFPELEKWLRTITPNHWSRAYFSGNSKSDVLVNNQCEVFNRQLVGGRDKPVVTCLEYIRTYLMKRIVVVHKLIEKADGPLTPRVAELFEKIKDVAGRCRVKWNGRGKYEVDSGGESQTQFVVNWDEKTCACRRWELTGIPCIHGVAVMYNMLDNGLEVGIPESYVSEVYWLETWKKVYENTIEPINGRDMWPVAEHPMNLLPPKHHKQVGRPKKKRKKSAAEMTKHVVEGGKQVRGGNFVTCSKCGNKGHNKKSCKGQGGEEAAT